MIENIFLQLLQDLVTKLLDGWSHLVIGIVDHTILYPFVFNNVHHELWLWSRDISLSFLTVIFLYGLIKTMLQPAMGWNGTDLRNILPRLVMAVTLILMSYQIVSMLLEINNALVSSIVAHASSAQIENLFLVRFLADPSNLSIGILILLLLLAVVVVVSILYVILTYFVRQAEIVFLTVLAPVMAAFWVLDESSNLWRTLVSELIGTIFVQSAQAVVLWLFLDLGFAQAQTDTGGQALNNLLTSFACMVLMLKVPTLLRSLIHNRAMGGHSLGKELAILYTSKFLMRGSSGGASPGGKGP